MFSVERVLGYAAVAFVIIIIPGPTVLFTISRALTYGRRTAVLSVIDAAERRRSIRQYEPAAVPRADVEEILRVAGLAPSFFNLQPWRFVVVDSPETKAHLVEAGHRQRPSARNRPT